MKGKLVYIVAAIFAVAFTVLLISMPRQQDWTDSFSQTSKQPYGSKLIEKNIHSFFPTIEKVDITAYQHLTENELSYDNEYEYNAEPSLTEENTEQESIDDVLVDTTAAVSSEEQTLPTTSDTTGVSETAAYDTVVAPAEEDELVNIDAISDKKLRKVFSNYIFINTDINFDETDLNALFKYVRKGNNVFIAATWFNGKIADTFNLKTDNTFLSDTLQTRDFVSQQKVKIGFRLLNKNFPEKNFTMKGLTYGNSFSSIDSSRRTEVLSVNSKNEVTLIRIQVGDGYFYLSAVPHAYTNYAFSQKAMAGYAASTFSYLPNQTTYWDEYYKVGRVQDRSTLSFLKHNKALWWSWRLALLGFLLYMIFESKRYQRMIPIAKRLRNSSVEFAYTMGRLYLQRGDHHDLATKKIQYFLEQIRHGYYLPTHEFTEDFKSRLTQKSGVERKKIEHLVNLISHMQKSKYCSKEDLIELNAKIDDFKNQSKLR